ncbi:hypothetical protein [Intestinibacter sp.]|uniref:hypothetical protein n=1 Tax=Intestinibacter sp. TaxID=1965304 RepID=UPI003F179C71
MKKIIKEGKFVDFKGLERDYTICAMIQNVTYSDYYMEIIPEDRDEFCHIEEPKAILSIGLSICHEQDMDKYNQKIGRLQAIGRALKCKNTSIVMTLDNYKFATDDLLNSVTDTFEKDFKRCPGKYIKGYNDAEIKWRKKHEQEVSNLGCVPSSNN